jgi:hypothetical protein
MTPLRVHLPYQRDAANVSWKSIFADDDINFDEAFGVRPGDDDASGLERQPWHADSNELQGLGLQRRVRRQHKDGVCRRRHRLRPTMPVSSVSGGRHCSARSGSGRTNEVAAQREREQHGACNRADCPDETSLARPMASTPGMLQRLPCDEHPSFELRWSRHRRVLTRELTPRLVERSVVMTDVSTRVICR